MISPDEAWRCIAARVSPLPPERVARRAAGGRVLVSPLAATLDVPAADVSAMDGYAVAGEVEPGESRPVAMSIYAGDAPGARLAPGHAARIMTGAPVPAGADRVIPVEATRAAPATNGVAPAEAAGGDRRGGGDPAHDAALATGTGDSDAARQAAAPVVTLLAAAAPGEHIRRRGEVQLTGGALLPAGAILTPGALSIAASHGYDEMPVHRLPRVAVLATGDEVVPPERTPGPGQLRDSHTDFLLAAGATLGLGFTPLGIAPDRAAELSERLRAGLRYDVLLVSGGVSMGELDLVEGVLERLGCTRHVDAVAIQPGKPMVFATHPGGVVFGLPGNPASVFVAFWLFVRPALARLAGRAAEWWPGMPATVSAPLPGAAGRDRFVAATVAWGAGPGGSPLARPLLPKGSHDLSAYASGTALLRIRAGAAPTPAGGPCELLPLPPP